MPNKKQKTQELSSEEILTIVSPFAWNGLLACDRCGHASHVETTRFRYSLQCGVCGEPLSLLATRDAQGFSILETAGEYRTRVNLVKDLEAAEVRLSRGLGAMVIGTYREDHAVSYGETNGSNRS